MSASSGSPPPRSPDPDAPGRHEPVADGGRGSGSRDRPDAAGHHEPVGDGEREPVVPDILAPGLRCVFVGINPGLRSAAARAHFANPRNDFWRLLAEAGLTPRLLRPDEQWELLRYGLGITNAAHRPTRGAGELRPADFADAATRLERLAVELRPAVLTFVGKEAYRGAFGERPSLGLQERRLGPARLFVLPSTSPANAAVPYPERLRWFRELAALLGP
ncbi:MAG TPA: mismatch-specific DNA-glycosylase [Candidatus Limnocylindrales bacterium]|nr:mismatch-specific DNA-glycosylase [Candidatus Limnocylindrales bacterium]